MLSLTFISSDVLVHAACTTYTLYNKMCALSCHCRFQ